jgi:hypothetical protein
MSIDAFHLIEKHLPDAALRPRHLQMLRASLQAAATLAPDRWTLTCNKTSLRVNVGMIEVLSFTRNEVNIVVDGPLFNQIEERTPLPCDYDGIFAEDGEPAYASVANSTAIFVTPADAPTAMQLVWPAHQALIRHAARTQVNPAVRKAHQAELATWLMR